MTKASQPLVSVIVNCFNGEHFLQQCLESIVNQSYIHWEIIFVDNNSSDSSSAIALSFSPRLKYFYLPSTVPLYEARNFAISKASGTVIAFLDCDDFWHPDSLAMRVREFQNGYRFVYSLFTDIDKYNLPLNPSINRYPKRPITRQLLLHNIISIGSVLVDRQLLVDHSFNPDFELLGDFDLWVRLSQVVDFKFVPFTLEYSRQHDSNTSNHKRHLWLSERRSFYRQFLSTYPLYSFPEILLYIFKTELKGLFHAR